MRRILVDECINPRLALRLLSDLPGSSVDTVRDLEWEGTKDHALIGKIESLFDVFVTIDKGFEFEHHLEELSFGIIVLTTANNQMSSYERLLKELLRQIELLLPGRAVRVVDPGR